MNDPREILARIRAQADAATPGPWMTYTVTPNMGSEILTAPGEGEAYGDYVVPEYIDMDNAEFIAAARTTVPALLDALEAVLEIHQDGGESQGYLDDGSYGDMPHCCTECGSLGEYGVLWPCPTVEAITTALEATK